jgi:hypothetical protein
MKLITEISEEFKYEIFLDEATNKKTHHIVGPFMQAEIVNRNGRKYPLHVMEKAVDKYHNDYIKHSRAYGELGHPSGPQINLDRVSHLILDLKRDGDTNTFIGKAKLADTPMGNIARGLLDSGAKLGVSSRGMGSLQSKDGIMEVQPDFQLATAADIVADPSAPGAFVKGVMENVDWIYDPVKDTWHEEHLHKMKKSLNKMKMNYIEENKLAIFEGYIKSLSAKNKFL